MADTAFKKVQVVGTSSNSLSEAAANAVARLGQTEPQMSWFEVVEQRGSIVNGKIQQFQVTLNVGVRLE